jgi:sporulation protein YlmC with PRC-barrel domain
MMSCAVSLHGAGDYYKSQTEKRGMTQDYMSSEYEQSAVKASDQQIQAETSLPVKRIQTQELVGMDVLGFRGDADVGEVEELLINPKTHKVEQIVVELEKGPFEGFFTKDLVVVQPEQLQYLDEQDKLRLTVDSNQLAGFRSDRDAAQSGQGEGFVHASDVIGTEVENSQGTEIGNIYSLIVDLPSGDISHAIINAATDPADRLIAVPTRLLSHSPEQEAVVANLTTEQIHRAPTFDEHAFSTDPTWDRNVAIFFFSEEQLQPTGVEDAQRGSGDGAASAQDVDQQIQQREREIIQQEQQQNGSMSR